MRISDAHLHLLNASEPYPGIGGAELLFSCVAQHSEWKTQISGNDPNVVKFYGIHPWYAEQWDGEVPEELRTILADDPKAQVGEIGMDSKRGDPSVQEKVFAGQLDIASEFGRCVNIHNIGCDGEIVRILKQHGKGCRSIILHSFKSDTSPFAGLDCYYSLNPRILTKSGEHVKALAAKIPKDRLLLETDYPFAPRGFSSMGGFITELADILGTEVGELAARTLENARRAIQ